jgi:hypothetical protein
MNANKFPISIRFTEKESIEFDYLMHKHHFKKASLFIKRCIFQKEFYVITYDESLYDVIDKLNEILYQYRKVGANYDQMIKYVIKAFGEEHGKHLLCRVIQNMIDLVRITKNIVEQVRALEEEYERRHPKFAKAKK